MTDRCLECQAVIIILLIYFINILVTEIHLRWNLNRLLLSMQNSLYSERISWSALVAITKYHRRGFTSRNLSSHHSEGLKFKIRVPAWSGSWWEYFSWFIVSQPLAVCSQGLSSEHAHGESSFFLPLINPIMQENPHGLIKI